MDHGPSARNKGAVAFLASHTPGQSQPSFACHRNGNGNRTRLTHPDGIYLDRWHDGLSRPTAVIENGAAMVVWQTYHPTGERNLVVRVGAGTGHFHDGIGRLNLFGQDFAGPLHDLSWTLTRNAASQIVSDFRSADLAWTGHYAVERAYTANGLNQYNTAGNATFGYDANGNLVSDGTRTFTYDVENRLVGASGGLVLAYDPLGRLFQTSGGASGTTRFLYDGDALVGEYGESGNVVLHRYVHGPGADEPWLWYEGALVTPATRRQLAADPQGSIAAIADGAGNRLAVNTYDEYGIPAATNTGRFQYTGQIWLPDLGMYHYKARVYSPTLGRFMQTDPVGYEGGINLYAYVGNDPMNFIDQSGAQAIPVPGCAGCHTSSGPARQSPVTVPLPTLPDPSRALGVLACVMNPLMCAQTIGEQVGQALMSDGRFTGDEVIIDDHIADSLGDRGWTEEGVRGLTETDPTGTSTDNRTVDGERLDDPSTVYGSAQGGYVVVNDRTGEVVQVSDRTDGNWRPDPRISWKDEVRRR